MAAPHGFCERLVGMEGSHLFFRRMTAAYAAFNFVAHPDYGPIEADRLAAELEASVAAVHAHVLGPDQWCVWATA